MLVVECLTCKKCYFSNDNNGDDVVSDADEALR